jgi:hypothetical protein
MFDNTAWFVPFIETYTSEKLLWAATPARHSFEKFPVMSDYAGLVADYAKQVAQSA